MEFLPKNKTSKYCLQLEKELFGIDEWVCGAGVLCGGSEGAARLPGCLGQSCSVSSPAPLNIPVIHLIQFHKFTQISSPLKKKHSNCAWVAPGVRTKPSANGLLTRPDRGAALQQGRRGEKITPFSEMWVKSISHALSG